MKKTIVCLMLLTVLTLGIFFSQPVKAEAVEKDTIAKLPKNAIEKLQKEIGSHSIRSRAYTDTVVRYFHQYQTRLTGNWAPNLHGYQYGTLNVRNGYAANGYTHLGQTSNSGWLTIEHKFAQNYRVW